MPLIVCEGSPGETKGMYHLIRHLCSGFRDRLLHKWQLMAFHLELLKTECSLSDTMLVKH